MTLRRRALLLFVAAALSGPARAAWTGNPAQQVEKGALVLGYQTAARDVELTSGGPTAELKNRGLFIEQRSAINPVLQLALRALPFTGRVSLENDALTPHMAGAGVGLYAAPPEPLGLVHLGAAAVWDLAGGARKRASSGSGYGSKRYDRIYWSELTFSAGASVSPIEGVSVYAGASFTSLRTRFTENGAKATLKESTPWGGFGGVSYSSNKAWFADLHLRGGGERSVGASLGYTY
jgi:hypothetical protein